MIFAARQLQEKYQEIRTHLYTNFVDLMKAFDTVNRDGLWKVRQQFSCPERFTHMSLSGPRQAWLSTAANHLQGRLTPDRAGGPVTTARSHTHRTSQAWRLDVSGDQRPPTPLRNKISSHLPPPAELGQKVVAARASPIYLACCDKAAEFFTI
ncbi:unnamed protein product [Schistocephalus solidus]|uniref:Reverse transcriptase domain-containing protein n=1 Tax=Schistocephalus solidus TaxID=70667 RepID=A0A183SGR7_SCHSO|nr:unnamed protein product [Schistocephalus solidus]